MHQDLGFSRLCVCVWVAFQYWEYNIFVRVDHSVKLHSSQKKANKYGILQLCTIYCSFHHRLQLETATR
jgi:hypothetical protein